MSKEGEGEREREMTLTPPPTGADPNMRDYGGRRPVDILSNKANERAKSKSHATMTITVTVTSHSKFNNY